MSLPVESRCRTQPRLRNLSQFSFDMRRQFFCGVALLISACSSSPSSPPGPIPLTALNGAWRPTTPEVGGLSYEFTLVLSGESITGTGQWAMLGGQSGTVAITGVASENVINLDLTLGQDSPGTLPFLIEHFAGQLQSPVRLTGTLTFPGGARTHTYGKIDQ
jgi:hypothetical protein